VAANPTSAETPARGECHAGRSRRAGRARSPITASRSRSGAATTRRPREESLEPRFDVVVRSSLTSLASRSIRPRRAAMAECNLDSRARRAADSGRYLVTGKSRQKRSTDLDSRSGVRKSRLAHLVPSQKSAERVGSRVPALPPPTETKSHESCGGAPVHARVDEIRSSQPSEAVAVAERPARFPGRAHRLLGRVLGLGRVAEEIAGQRVARS